MIVFTLVQGPTLPWVARKLRLVHDMSAYDVGIESAPLAHLGADLLEVQVPPGRDCTASRSSSSGCHVVRP